MDRVLEQHPVRIEQPELLELVGGGCERAYNGLMRTLHDSPIDIPPHVEAWVDAAAAHPAVRSVILYGSRSIGRHREDSDWDIALVTDEGERPDVARLDECWMLSPKHGVTVLSESDMLARKATYASLPSEVALGVVLKGQNYTVEDDLMARRLVGTNTPEARSVYIALTEHMWKFLREEITNVGKCRRSEYKTAATGFGGASADAAERAVKLATLSLGLPFQASHSVHELAQDLPDEWRERLETLNGDTDRLHAANYGERLLREHEIRTVCERTERRLHLTLDLVADLAKMRNPLDSADSRDVLRRMAETDPEVGLMRELCSDVAPELVGRFSIVRESCIKRFAHDSADLRGISATAASSGTASG